MTSTRLTTTARLILLTALIGILSISIAFAQASGVTETKLENGLTVLMKEVHAAPVFTAQVWFRVGSRNEHTGITGISHVLEHMLFNSSKNFKKGEITRLIRERGGIENAATWTDFTYYWQLLSSENLELSFKMLAERVGNALLVDSEFAKERTVVLSEMQGDENNPDWLLWKAVGSTAFEVHPYRWPVIGWQSDVENIDRSQLAGYYHSYYHPNNATLVLVGDFDSKKALGLVKKYFSTRPASKLPRPVYTKEPAQHGRKDIIVRREGNAERVMLAYHIPAISDPDTYPLMVLDQILSGGRSSRLYQTLVEKQLATGAWSSSGSRRDPSLFILGATARQGVNADALEKALLEQVEVAKSTAPTAEEMLSAKNQLEAYTIFQNDSVSDQGEQLGYYATITSWRFLETLIPRIKAVTPEQVKAVAGKYFTTDNLTVGKFIPTSSANAGGGSAAPVGPAQFARTWDAAYYGGAKAEDTSPPAREAAMAASRRNSPAPGPRPLAPAKPHRQVLDNGMVVIVQENHSNPTVAIQGNLKAGSYFDPNGKTGVASLVAEMVGRGTAKRSALELAKAADSVGANVDVSAGVESAGFAAKSLAKDFPLMLDLLSDELKNASFPEDQFARAKGQTLSGLEQSKESPEARASRAFYNAIFPADHPYWDPALDDEIAAVQSITRDDLVAFHKSYYRPDTAVIVIVGDVKTADALALVKQYFGDWAASGPAPKMDIPTIQPPSQGKRIVVPMQDKSEMSIYYGYPMGIKRTDPDFYALRVMNQILGGAGALASLLGEDIREKQGLAYNVYSTFDATLGAGAWYAALGTAPANADKAIAALQTDVTKFRSTGATPRQFKQAREFIIGVFPIALETNAGLGRTLLNAETYGLGMDYIQRYPQIYRSVTLEQVNAAAKKYLHPEAATLVIAGPYEEKQ